MQTKTDTKRNEGGRYSALGAGDWYKEHEAANLARIEAAEDAQRALATALARQVGNAVAALPEAAERITKAAWLVQHQDVWPLTDGTFLVGSDSDTELAYLVERQPAWSCECGDARGRKRTCKHQFAAMLTVRMGAAYQPRYV